MQISNPREHHIYKKSDYCIFKGIKIVLHTFDAYQNKIEIIRLGHYYTGKRIQEHMKVCKSKNPHDHHIHKNSEECIFKGIKIVLHTLDAYQNQIDIMR